MANKWFQKLAKLDGAITDRRSIHSTVIDTPSPSASFIWGNGWGLPQGYTAVFYGPPKSGKSLLSTMMMGKLHQDDPEAFCVRFSTEMRDKAQLDESQMKLWGIDPERYMAIETNTPDGVFDTIETKLGAMCQEGMPLKLVVIDSINSIQGKRALGNDSILANTIGDLALTIGDGLKRILAVQRKYNFAVILIAQIRSEMDPGERMRGVTSRMAASHALQHYAEYFVHVDQDRTKAGRSSLDGTEFIDESMSDLLDKGEKTAHKIRCTMKDSSLGPKGRTGVFTLDYKRGVINTHEEVFLLGVNRGVIEKPNQLSYKFGDRSWKGQPAMLEALKTDKELYDAVLKELKRRDRETGLPLTLEEAASAQEESA